jgi:methionyl-tRNA formyltransferase
MKIVVFADGIVGQRLVSWLSEHFPSSIALFVTISENEIYDFCKLSALPVIAINGSSPYELVHQKVGAFDLALLFWWPSMIKPETIALARSGFINTHPSLLPMHRGKHSNFWAMREGQQFGVSLHFLGQGIDDGDVVAQRTIPYGWEDNGGTIYHRALDAMVQLVIETFPSILSGEITRLQQNNQNASFHYARELEPASLIDMDATYRARDLINLLRARTFEQQPSCSFEDNEEVYEVRINIVKKS